MWVRRGGLPNKLVILFDYDPSRSAKVAWRLTEDFKGYLQSGSSGYDGVGKRDGGRLAAEGLVLIQRIYRIEKVACETEK